MLTTAINMVSQKYFGVDLRPGATMSDHTEGIRGGFKFTWPAAENGQCWPHVKRKVEKGEYFPKTWEHFEEVGHAERIRAA